MLLARSRESELTLPPTVIWNRSGAALWVVDYVMQAMMIGVDRLYFHQGTIGNCESPR